MSMEMHVLFCGKLPSKAALTRAMKELGFPLSIAPPGGSLEQQKGFMPMRLRREETGVEFDVFEGRAAVDEMLAECSGDVDPSFDRSANFRWGGDENEMLCALCGAAALAKLVNGIVLEEQEGKLLTLDEAAACARIALGNVAKDPPARTRPADIKRYLKPLLELRSDLVLAGRLLVIRPVRHLLRGVLFDPSSDKYSISGGSYVKPLHELEWSDGHSDYFRGGLSTPVWQPYFEPLLFDSLADVFERLGTLTTLTQFASAPTEPGYLLRADFMEARVSSLVLAGERERAIQHVREFDPDRSRGDFGRRLWWLVDSEVNALCAEFRAREQQAIKALKLSDVWEPSAFPVEVPAGERAKVAEPAFSTAPWISRPSWLLGEMPETLGEVRFSRGMIPRGNCIVPVVPLTREQAEERHRELEGYTMTVRLPDGLLLLMTRSTGWDRNEPPHRFRFPPDPEIHIELHGASRSAHVKTWRDLKGSGQHYLLFISVYKERPAREIWYCSQDLEEGTRRVWDKRSEPEAYAKTSLTTSDRELITCQIPEFGEYADLLERLRSLLRVAGYGEFSGS